MAGKSTYLRTVGVNYLLACIGAPVWAKQMKIYPARLVTSPVSYTHLGGQNLCL